MSLWYRLTYPVTSRLSHGLAKIARFSATWPKLTITISMCVVVLFTLGLLLQVPESDTGALFAPSSSVSLTNRDAILEMFPLGSSSSTTILLELRDPSGDIRNSSLLLEAWRLVDLIASIEYPKNSSLADNCARRSINGSPSENCLVSSFIDYFDGDRSLLRNLTSEEIGLRLLDPTSSDADNVRLFAPAIYSADFRALRYTWSFPSMSPLLDEIETAIADQREIMAQSFPSFILHLDNGAAGSSELDRSTGGDIILFVLSLIFISLVTLVIFLRIRNVVYSQALMSQAGLLTSLAATGASFGFVGACQLPFASFIAFLLLLIVAVGADDTIILVLEIRHVPLKEHTPAERVELAYERVGPSIFLTNMSSCLAFALAAISPFPAITYFSIYAAVGFLFQFILTMTFFAACLSLDALRMQQGRVDTLMCIKRPKKLEQTPMPAGDTFLEVFFRKYYPPALLSLAGKLIVLAIFIGLVAFAGYGASQTTVGLDVRILYTDDSFLQDYIAADDRYFPLTPPITIFVRSDSLADKQLEMLTLRQLCESARPTVGSIDFFLDSFLAWSNTTAPYNPAEFDRVLREEFIPSTAGSRFDSQVVFDNATGALSAFRFTVRTEATLTSELRIATQNMFELREAISSSTLNPRDFFSAYVFYEGDAQVLAVALQSMGIILGAVFVISAVLLNSLIAAVITTLCIAFGYVLLFAWMWLLNIALDTVSMINLQIAAGFLLDSIAHLTHSFQFSSGSRNERTFSALEHMGANVTYAGVSTLLGIILLLASKSQIFYIFFAIFAGIVLVGLILSIVILPVALALVGPTSAILEDSDSKMGNTGTLPHFVNQKSESVPL